MVKSYGMNDTKEAFTWKESFTNHDYDTLEPFKIPSSRLRIHSQTCHDFDKNKEMESISHKTPDYDDNIKPHSSTFEVTLDNQYTKRDLVKTTRKMRGHSYNDSVDPT